MQLVNIETPQSFISNDLISAIQSGQLSAAKELIKEKDDLKQIFRSFYVLSSKQVDIKNYLSSAIVYTDAIVEIIKRLFPENPEQIIQSSLDYFCSLKYSDQKYDLPETALTDKNSHIIVGELSETIEKGELEKAFIIAKKLLNVIDSKKYFNDLLLEIAAKSYTNSGESIVVLNSICKGIEFLDWKMTDDLVWFILNLLISEKFKSELQELKPSDKEIKYAEYVLRAASETGEYGINLLFMGHARQVYRSASVKYKEIWAYLSSFIQKKLENISIVEMEEIEPVKGDLKDFERSLNIKEVQLTMTLINQLLKSGNTSADIFRSLTLHMMQLNQFKYPENIIYLNVARRLAAALDYPRNLHIFKSFIGYIYSNNINSN